MYYVYNNLYTYTKKRFDLELFLVVPLQKQCTKRLHRHKHHQSPPRLEAANEEQQREIEMIAPKLLPQQEELFNRHPILTIVVEQAA